jgi:hypothetical protein
MASPVWQSVNADTPDRLLFDAGALYRDYGEDGEDLIGATRGGSTFNVDREDREIEVDGVHGPVQGLRRTIRHTATLEVTFLEMSEQTFVDLTRGTSTSDGTHHTVTPDNEIVDADFYTNIALVAEINNSSDPAILKLLNAQPTNEWDISTDDDDEGQLTVTFEAHYDPAALDTVPYEIMFPVSAS